MPSESSTTTTSRAREDLTAGERIIRAILERRTISMIYQGLPRVVEPHMVGIAEAGEPILVAYQTGGASRSGDLPGWRTFITTEVERVEENEAAAFVPRSDFTHQFYGMLEVFARV